MAQNYTLEAQPRAVTGKKVSQLRTQGLVPAVVYGPRQTPVHVQIPYRPLQLALMQAGGTHLIDLRVADNMYTVIAREVQRDVLRGDILHVDFFAVDEASTIRVEVPVHFTGESPAVLARKGILITGLTMLSIETLPSKLVDRIDIDLSSLVEVGDAVHVRDVKVDAGITILNDPDEMIARISQTPAARAAEEEAEEAEASPAEVEIIQKGKIEEEEF